MNIRSVTYISIIVAGMGVSMVLPIAQMAGCSLTALFLALFQPYFGWKKTVKINLALYLILLPIIVPTLIEVNQISNAVPSILQFLPNQKPKDIQVGIGLMNFAFGFPQYYIIELVAIFCEQIMMVRMMLTVLKKTGIYHIFIF